MNQRTKPCLCIECPECGAIFKAVGLCNEFQQSSEDNNRLLSEITSYAEQGYNVSFKNNDEFKLNFCDHIL